MNTPRQYSLVKFDFDAYSEEYQKEFQNTFKLYHRYIFLGEIPNMPGHCIVADDLGRLFVGYHTEDFVEIAEYELDVFEPIKVITSD
jgi:hypothetical protein